MSCDICKPVRLPQEVFEQIKPFPDPEPGVDQHYKAFNDIYGTKTSEKYWLTLSKRSKTQWVNPAVPWQSLTCLQCWPDAWVWEVWYVEVALNVMSFLCCSPLQDLDDLTAELREKVMFGAYTVMNPSNSCTIQQSMTPYVHVFTVGSLNRIKMIKITLSVCHAKTSLPLAKRVASELQFCTLCSSLYIHTY